jgi:transcriptional regulator with XRE-family HTH domain
MEKRQENPKVLLGRRIRFLRNAKGWTQQELGARADVNYKFLGDVERGNQNPSLEVLSKIADALEVKILELFRFEHEVLSRKELETEIKAILKGMPDESLRQVLMIFRAVYPFS